MNGVDKRLDNVRGRLGHGHIALYEQGRHTKMVRAHTQRVPLARARAHNKSMVRTMVGTHLI